jgi:glycosyltransferase involved in cell wall biosynthesis
MTTVSAENGLNVAKSYSGKKVLVCIPAYNEANNIANVVQKARRYTTEIIVYDDGSSDGTSEVAKTSGASVIRNRINKGYGAAITTLFQKAKEDDVDIMVTLDSDGQHDPDQIPQVLEPILKGESDIVIGSRFINLEDRQKIPGYRSIGIKAITKVAGVASYRNITDSQSGFRAYNRRALVEINLFQEGMEVSTEILLKAKEKNLRIKEIPVTINYESKNVSTHNPVVHGIRVFHHVVQVISLRHPLLFYGCPGIALLLIAAFFTSNALELFSTTRFVSTNMILISVGLAIVGAICLATGAIVYTLVALFKGKLKEV